MSIVRYTSDNHLKLLQNGDDFFPALIAAVDHSVSEIYLETYIFFPDEVGRRIIDALKRAVLRGVDVHVIIDWLGTGPKLCGLLSREFSQSGIQYHIFNSWFKRGFVRLHRKICVVDHRIAFVGGINILNDLRYDYNRKQMLASPRQDFAVKIEGALAMMIYQEAIRLWEQTGKLSLWERFSRYRSLYLKDRIKNAKTALAGFIVRDNFRNRRTIQRAYLKAMGMARRRIILSTPYFAPGKRFRNALASAASRGVEVILLIGCGEFWVQDSVAQSFYPKLLKDGIKVYEYRKTQLHGKVAVIDDSWATVGSSNCDGLSLFLNHEANVVIRDAYFAQDLKKRIEAAISDAEPVFQSSFMNRPWYKRLWYGTAFMIYRVVMRTITWGDYN
ncbi:cardiolipin synthase ClsB [Oxalobacter paraformigenes]|uniref:Cardiolipin synthase B n=1 Tax=Oxalobacter paraformigenes TaxID=556268 RepID=C3X5I2_9BURK|nr:cardiolipin synthase ClsB [Oxalobacter paraformigenes]EEO28468.1 hypothetical protein OFAG_01621 [Oxalobacter paraformigenes]